MTQLEEGYVYANKGIEAGVKYCKENNLKMNIAVFGDDDKLVAFARMNNAWPGSIDIAMRKAHTAQLFNMPTDAIGKLSQPGQPLYGIEHSNGGLITFAGGVLITMKNGTVIGSVGVSGDSVDNDKAVATIVADAIANEIAAICGE